MLVKGARGGGSSHAETDSMIWEGDDWGGVWRFGVWCRTLQRRIPWRSAEIVAVTGCPCPLRPNVTLMSQRNTQEQSRHTNNALVSIEVWHTRHNVHLARSWLVGCRLLFTTSHGGHINPPPPRAKRSQWAADSDRPTIGQTPQSEGHRVVPSLHSPACRLNQTPMATAIDAATDHNPACKQSTRRQHSRLMYSIRWHVRQQSNYAGSAHRLPNKVICAPPFTSTEQLCSSMNYVDSSLLQATVFGIRIERLNLCHRGLSAHSKCEVSLEALDGTPTPSLLPTSMEKPQTHKELFCSAQIRCWSWSRQQYVSTICPVTFDKFRFTALGGLALYWDTG